MNRPRPTWPQVAGTTTPALGPTPHAGSTGGFPFPAVHEFPVADEFPGTHGAEPGTGPADAPAATAERYRRPAAEPDLERWAARRGFRPRRAVTAPGGFRVEGGRDADHPKIARVIHDRIKARTPLQPGTAVPHARERGTPEVSERGIAGKTPYNACLGLGLPPELIATWGRRR
ncbi:hypothetical protein GCM10010517_09910 [Streptosporangium fragile]|uniref:Uncharacterized protein n=1 Tax=Streptosporangium fragile TaxID=46186 RepID=A0ABN3VTD0_9ACTN